MYTLFEIYLSKTTSISNKNHIKSLLNPNISFYDETIIDDSICYIGQINTEVLIKALTVINPKFTSYRYTFNNRLCIVIDLTEVISLDLINVNLLYPSLYVKKKV